MLQRNTLGLLYAQLELQSELLRAVTPFYQTYQFKALGRNPGGWSKVLADKSKEAVAIRKYWKSGPTWHTVRHAYFALFARADLISQLDIVDAALASQIDRAELSRQITRWEQ